MVERIKIVRNQIVTKNSTGDTTFDSNRLYLKTVSSGDFAAGGLRKVSCPRGKAVGQAQLGNIVADPLAGASLIEGGSNLVPNPEGHRVAYSYGSTQSFPSGSKTPLSYKSGTSAGGGSSYRKILTPRGADDLIFVTAKAPTATSLTPQLQATEPFITDPSCANPPFCGITAWIPEVGSSTSQSSSDHDLYKKYYASGLPTIQIFKETSASTAVSVGTASLYLRRRMGHFSSSWVQVRGFSIFDGFYVYLSYNSINWEQATYRASLPNPRNYNWFTWDPANNANTVSQNTLVHAQNWFWWAPEMVFAHGDPVNLGLSVTT